MTVQEAFEVENLDMSDVAYRSCESPYWEKTLNFITEKWQTDFEDLTIKQAQWVQRVIDDLIEERINKRTKNH
jgi:hypothetical protein